jgi:hypothetical protein
MCGLIPPVKYGGGYLMVWVYLASVDPGALVKVNGIVNFAKISLSVQLYKYKTICTVAYNLAQYWNYLCNGLFLLIFISTCSKNTVDHQIRYMQLGTISPCQQKIPQQSLFREAWYIIEFD